MVLPSYYREQVSEWRLTLRATRNSDGGLTLGKHQGKGSEDVRRNKLPKLQSAEEFPQL
jgi:hypothetical protein